MTRRCVIGGIAFRVDEALSGLATDGFSDLDLYVHWVDRDMFHDLDNAAACRVTGPDALEGAVDPEANTCWLPDLYSDPTERGWQLRQMAPIFSTVMDRLVLHAGAVEMARGVVGFIGTSGTGKSTLAHFLSDRGGRFVADDLLPIRFTPAAESPVGHRLCPVAALCFLRRENTEIVTLDRLSTGTALEGLIYNGFGEHGSSPSWQFQFDSYHRLAESVPMFDLVIPDDVAELPRVSSRLVETLGQDLSQEGLI